MRALLVLLIAAAWRSCLAEREYCRPCLSCWPSDDVIQAFNKTLTGYVIQPSEAEKFEEAAVAYNRRLYEHPGLIVEPITTSIPAVNDIRINRLTEVLLHTFSPARCRLHDMPFSKPLYMDPVLRRQSIIYKNG